MKHKPLISAVLITSILAVKSFAGNAQPADVCVYGGSSGGVVAAVQAARMGKRVVLVEPGRHLGGMMAGGLSWSDVGSAERAKLFGGLAREVFERMAQQIRSGALGSAAQALISMRVTLRESHIAWASFEGALTGQTGA